MPIAPPPPIRIAARLVWLAVPLAAVLATGCAAAADAPRTGRLSLVDFGLWQAVPWTEDAWAVDGPGPSTCTAAAVDTSKAMLEIDTDLCTWVTLRQPLQEEIRVGETVRLIYQHLYLFSETAATAVVELRIGGERYFRLDVPIPGHEAVHRPKWIAVQRVPAGTLAEFHVHNHGANSYRLVDLTTGD